MILHSCCLQLRQHNSDLLNIETNFAKASESTAEQEEPGNSLQKEHCWCSEEIAEKQQYTYYLSALNR